MGLIRMFKGKNINEGLQEYRETENAVLIDVREPDEYAGGHIPGSLNVPLSSADLITSAVEDKETPIFAYCLSGARSSQAASLFKRQGYKNVTNIGGINGYNGPLER